jgi:hypothetical protein
VKTEPMRRRAHVSPGNTKLGIVLNVSLTPIASCPRGIPCAKMCYALRACKRGTVRRAWSANLDYYNHDPDGFFAELDAHLLIEKPDLFRAGVGGDIPDQEYLRRLYLLARAHPRTKFLAFTKNHGLNFRGRPSNFSIVFSMWPGWGDTRKRMPRAWLNDPANPDPRIPADAIPCSGTCETCGLCWDLAQLGKDVILSKI